MRNIKDKWVICLGAGKSQIPLIKKAKLLGFKVLAVDINCRSPGFGIADDKIIESTHNSKAIIAKIKGKHFSGLLARTTGNALFTAADIIKDFSLLGINLNLAKIATSKSALRQFCLANSINMPYGIAISSPHQLDKNKLKSCIVVKPDFTLVGKKSIKKVKLTNENLLHDAILLALSSSGNGVVEVEEFIEGYDCTYLAWIKNGTPSTLLSWDELNGFDEEFNLTQFGISMPSISLHLNHKNKIEKEINKFTKLFPNVSTMLAFSFRIDKKGNPWLIEIHGDLTGDQILDKLAPMVTNCDCLLEIVNLFVNKNSTLPSCLEKFSNQKPSAIIYQDKLNSNTNEILFSKDNIFLLHEKINNLTSFDIIKNNVYEY